MKHVDWITVEDAKLRITTTKTKSSVAMYGACCIQCE